MELLGRCCVQYYKIWHYGTTVRIACEIRALPVFKLFFQRNIREISRGPVNVSSGIRNASKDCIIVHRFVQSDGLMASFEIENLDFYRVG